MTETRVHLKVLQPEPAAHAAAHAPRALTGDETVDAIVDTYPQLRPVLMAYGLCTCCSGSLSLRQNAEAHGLSLSEILADLESELAKGA